MPVMPLMSVHDSSSDSSSFKPNTDPSEFLCELKKGHYVGETCFKPNQRRNCSILATSHC